MLNQTDKTKIVSLIESEIQRIGSQKKLSIKCDVSDATLSNMRTGKWQSISDDIWLKVGNNRACEDDEPVRAKSHSPSTIPFYSTRRERLAIPGKCLLSVWNNYAF